MTTRNRPAPSATTGVDDAARVWPSPWPGAQVSAPWRETLTPAVAAALTLPLMDQLGDSALTDVDVIVVGAGIAGLSAARAASAAGARTLALEEAPGIGYGATGRNAGILSAGINMGLAELPPDDPNREMWPATTRALLALAEEARQPGAFLSATLTGALSLAETPAAARRLAREARAHASRWVCARNSGRPRRWLSARLDGSIRAAWSRRSGCPMRAASSR